MLGGLDTEEPEQVAQALPKLQAKQPAPPGTKEVSYFSIICLLRG